MKIEEQIMNDPNLARYVDKQRGWINEAFMDGVRWADKTMIDKACEWLKDNLYNSLDRDGRPTIDSPSCTNVNEFIKEFRKAMEGE